MAAIKAPVPFARGFEVGGPALPVAALQDLTQQRRAEAAGLPLRSRTEEEEVVVGLLWVTLLHPFQDGNGSIGVFLRSLDVPGGELLGVLAGGLATGRNPDGSGHRNGVGGVELAVGLVDVDGDLEDGPQDLGAPVGVVA